MTRTIPASDVSSSTRFAPYGTTAFAGPGDPAVQATVSAMPRRKPPDRTSTAGEAGQYRRQWRDYRTRSGRRVVRAEIMALEIAERAAVTAAMADVAKHGKKAARHLRGEIHEVRAEGADVIYRLLFATEGRYSQVLLALVFFVKKTQRTPPVQIDLAERRLADWRSRGQEQQG